MKIEREFKKKLNEVFYVEPNKLAPNILTFAFKDISSPFKKMPFLVIIPFSILCSIILYFVFNSLMVKLVSILQYGF